MDETGEGRRIKQLEEENRLLLTICSDYDSIYRVDFETEQFAVCRLTEGLPDNVKGLASSGNRYSEVMEKFIEQVVEKSEQEYMRAMTEKQHVLTMLEKKERYVVSYRTQESVTSGQNFEIHFVPAGGEKRREVVVCFRNVDELTRQREQRTQQDIEETLEGARTGIWTIELEEGCPPRMYADGTMRKLLGVSGEVSPEACYRTWYEGIDPDYIEMVQECVDEIFRFGRSEVIYPWHHPDLGQIYVRCGGVPYRKFDWPGRCLKGYHQDITETMVIRQRQEKALLEALVEMRRANSAKTEFLSHMSHDIRTPINGILGMLSIAEKNAQNPEKMGDCLEKIRRSAEHLLSLVNDVLDISKLESGSVEFTSEPFSIYEVLSGCADMIRPQAEENGLQFLEEQEGIEHPNLIGSPLHLRQILINVMGNAVKYNRPGGSIRVHTEETALEDGSARYQFTIEDTGIGMSEGFLEHVFEPFTQERSNARTTWQGTGLGMSITRSIVEQMGGTISVTSKLGTGSRFVIELPLKIDPNAGKTAEKEEPEVESDITGARVLLVEDNPLNREIAEYLLENAGALVETAEDGQQAVDLFARSPIDWFDCILMDVMMPVMDGLKATRAIRRMTRSDAKEVPIIALTANAFAEDVRMAQQAGMNQHLSKPLEEKILFQTIAHYRKRPTPEENPASG